MPFKITQFLQASLFAFICSHQVIATDDFEALDNSMVSISGFGSLFVTQAGEENLGYYNDFSNHPQTKDLSLSTDSKLGLQLDATFNSQLSSTLQLVFKNSIKKNLNETIKWANLKYKANDELSFKVGRMALDIHMLSEYRDVGFAYLWVRPIVEFYSPIVFNHFDGVDLSYTRQLDSGSLQLKMYTGLTDTYSFQSVNEVVRTEAKLSGFSALYENYNWKLRASIADGKMRKVSSPTIQTTVTQLSQIPTFIWPEIQNISNEINPDDANIVYYSIGFSYDDDIQIQSEFSITAIENWALVPSTYSAYISLAKSFDDITPYITLSTIRMKDSPYQVAAANPTGNTIQDLTFSSIRSTIQNEFNTGLVQQNTLSLGFRWDLKSNLSLKAQWDYTRIKDKYTSLWHDYKYPSSKNTMNTFSMGLNFIF